MKTVRTMKVAPKTAEQKANEALYAAAEKAGMARALGSAQVEVVVSTYQGKTIAYLAYDPENHEREDFVFPKTAYERAEKWLSVYRARQGWKAGWS